MSAMQRQSTVGKDVSFERIRRITGYLVGTWTRDGMYLWRMTTRMLYLPTAPARPWAARVSGKCLRAMQKKLESTETLHPTPCGIPSPYICSRTVRTSEASRKCLATPIFPPHRFTSAWTLTGWEMCTWKHIRDTRACLKKAFCKMYAPLCGTDFSNTL